MPLSAAARRLGSLAAVFVLTAALAGCASDLGLVQERVQGYDLSQDALAQIRPGQSQTLVVTVLGSPQLTNDFGTESAYYYISSHVSVTNFGTQQVLDRTVLAIYFDKNKRVKDRAVYTLKDGRTIAVETRRTQSFGEDRTFIDSILGSFTGAGQP